jgi:hypothetical protein
MPVTENLRVQILDTMNQLLKHYQVDVEYPDVSGAEHLQMLQIRDALAEQEPLLDPQERQALAAADQRLVEQSAAFYAELSRFIDLAQHRQERQIASSHWWWYLDVLVQLPQGAMNTSSKAVAR